MLIYHSILGDEWTDPVSSDETLQQSDTTAHHSLCNDRQHRLVYGDILTPAKPLFQLCVYFSHRRSETLPQLSWE